SGPGEPTFRDIIRDTYFTFDRRTLGFARFFLGLLLIGDLFRRTWDWEAMFSNEGVLPTHVNLWRPQGGNWSLLNAFSTPAELWALWAVMLATFFCVFIGYKTRLAQVLSLVFVTSMNGRVLLIENGGYVAYNLLLLWTCFLPMADRFSVDAMLESMRRKREATAADLNDRSDLLPEPKQKLFVSLVGLAIMIQIAAIYFFNVVHKTGPAWRNGTAVHFVLYVDRMVTPLIGLVREHLPFWFILFLTKFVLAAEAAIPVCLLSPLGRVWARRLTIVLMNALHLGFGTVFVLGPFAWALCVFSTLLFTTEDWQLAIQTMRRRHRARTVLFDPRSGLALLACRILARMDRFELLSFQERSGLAEGIAVESGGALLVRSRAWADIVAAIPLGPVVAWLLRVPVLSHLVDAVLGALEGKASRFFGLKPPAETVLAPAPAPILERFGKVLLVLREALVVLMLVAAINQAMTELWVVNRRIKVPQPEPLRALAHKLRFLQGWFMFSPNPVMDDGTLVVDAITIDGRRIDPFTGKEPDWDLTNAKSLGYNQIWCDYYNRMHLSQNSPFRDAMKEYMYRLPERTGRPEDAIVGGEVYWIQDMNPKWRETKSYKFEKQKLFSFENPKTKAQAANP
ncbi:MAG TPA: HTTM domain-containing protein, partial [Polyangiaceae bacterium]|nr:HTTM domain-containing protein [Polyangiaceae bacterium]